jgi:hypothetical protein
LPAVVVGLLILVLAYFMGIALVGAGLGVLITHVIWSQIGNEDSGSAGESRLHPRRARLLR